MSAGSSAGSDGIGIVVVRPLTRGVGSSTEGDGPEKTKKQRKKTPTDNPKPHKRRAMFQEVDPNESEDTVEPKKKKSKGSSSVPG